MPGTRSSSSRSHVSESAGVSGTEAGPPAEPRVLARVPATRDGQGPPGSRRTYPVRMDDDFRRHARFCPHGRPVGVRRLDVQFDYGAFPVWAWHEERQVDAMVGPEHLGVSAELTDALRAWSTWQDAHSQWGGGRSATAAQWAEHTLLGRRLAERLEAETGAAVVYGRPTDPDCATCRPNRS